MICNFLVNSSMKNKIFLNLIFSLLLLIPSCENKDLSFTITPAIGFSDSSMQVRASDANEVDIFLSLNSPLSTDASVKINVIGINGFVYGVDYTTEPAATGGLIDLNLASGSTKAAVRYLGLTQSVTTTKTVLFLLESGTNITLGQPATQDFTLELTEALPLTITHNFENCVDEFSVPPGFIEVTVPGFKADRGWGCRSNGTDGSRAPRASAFGGNDGEDNAWLIMNPANLSGYNSVSLSFDVNSAFDGPGKIIVQWSSDYDGSGDPSGFTWNELTDINSQLPAPGLGIWTAVSGNITGITGSQFYLAFQYVDGTSAASSSWDIDNLILNGI